MAKEKRKNNDDSNANIPPSKRQRTETTPTSKSTPKSKTSGSKTQRKTPSKAKITVSKAKTKDATRSETSSKKKISKQVNTSKQDEVKRDKHGKLIFPDHPEFKPNLTPKEVIQAGSFGGTYFRPINSSVTGEKYSGVWKEFPSDWFDGLSIPKQVTASTYHQEVNTYKVKCGGSLEMWETSGWIVKQDPYGWFQWYCRFYLGRRTDDDVRQIGRWSRCAGDKGRWRNNLITKVVHSGCGYDNAGVSPVVRQTLQQWGYRLTEEDFKKYAKKVKAK